jgi:acetyl esterase/lipase
VRVPYGPDTFQFGELLAPEGKGPHPVVVVIHGGFWRAKYGFEYMTPLCEALTGGGVATWSLEYRRIGNPGGGWPGTLDDVAAGARHLRSVSEKYGLDLDRTIALGHSAGGHLALWLSSQSALSLHGVVALAAVADLRRAWELRLSKSVVADFLGGGPEDFPERYKEASPIERLPIGIRQILIHGTLDPSVPFEISERYVSKAASLGDPAELIPLKDSHHFELVQPGTWEFARVQQVVMELV